MQDKVDCAYLRGRSALAEVLAWAPARRFRGGGSLLIRSDLAAGGLGGLCGGGLRGSFLLCGHRAGLERCGAFERKEDKNVANMNA